MIVAVAIAIVAITVVVIGVVADRATRWPQEPRR
jgi:hypothetical protein